jgi:hypothetical protein
VNGSERDPGVPRSRPLDRFQGEELRANSQTPRTDPGTQVLQSLDQATDRGAAAALPRLQYKPYCS